VSEVVCIGASSNVCIIHVRTKITESEVDDLIYLTNLWTKNSLKLLFLSSSSVMSLILDYADPFNSLVKMCKNVGAYTQTPSPFCIIVQPKEFLTFRSSGTVVLSFLWQQFSTLGYLVYCCNNDAMTFLMLKRSALCKLTLLLHKQYPINLPLLNSLDLFLLEWGSVSSTFYHHDFSRLYCRCFNCPTLLWDWNFW